MLALLPLSAIAAGTSSLKGAYATVPGQEFRYDGKTVEVVEFMSFYCGHCYEFENSIPIIKGNFPGKVKWTRMPIYWGKGSSKPGEAYLLAVDAGKGEQMARAIFHANFVEKKDIGALSTLDAIAARLGLPFDFSRRLRSGEKAAEAGQAIEKAQMFMIEQTPSIVVAGNVLVSPSMAGHDIASYRENAITVIDSILK